MSASRCSPLCALAAAAALALAGCENRDVEPRPFRLVATAGGQPLGATLQTATGLAVNGVAARRSATELFVAGAVADDGTPWGDVVLSFDGAAARDVAFPPQLDGAQVRAIVVVDPAHAGPRGEPMPVVGYRVALGAAPVFKQQFLLAEGTYAEASGLPVIGAAPFQLSGVDADPPDLPFLLIEDGGSTFEPAECGLVYYDLLDVIDDVEGEFVGGALLRGERREVSIGDPADPPWTVLHVESWHRDGRCDGQAQAWHQLAAWRPPPAPVSPPAARPATP